MTETKKIPHHVAIIMDGNGRWGEQKDGNRGTGHIEGAKRVKETLEAAGNAGVKVLTVYAFSSENWNRPQAEVDLLMQLFEEYLERDIEGFYKENSRVIFIGDRSRLSPSLRTVMQSSETKTAECTGCTLQIALSYGGRQEILGATKRLIEAVQSGAENIENLEEGTISKYMDTSQVADPDLVIRTGGETRLSNFLPWQSVYAELLFIDTLWPDFTSDVFTKCLNEYATRERRRGKTSAQLS